MMKIAVIQMHYPKGHKRLDQEYLKILSKDHELFIVDDGDYFTDTFCSIIGAERFRVRPLMVKRCELLKKIMHYINLTVVLFTLKYHRKEYDVLLILNIHNALYSYKWLPKKKIVLFHHQDIDAALSYPPYSKVLKKEVNRFLHICLAGFIRDGFIDTFSVDPEKVYVVFQPLVFDSRDKQPVAKENLLIGIGRSTDETIIQKLVEYDEVCDSTNGNTVVLRSKQMEYKGSIVTVINGFMHRDQYESLYDRARVSIVTYPNHYKLRYSGIMDDSLSKGLMVFANDNPCSRYFASNYPSCVKVFKTLEELWRMINDDLPNPDKDELKSFSESHSPDNVRKQINIVLAD